MKSEREIYEIAGKMRIGAASITELQYFLEYTTVLEQMVREASDDDFFGTEGWKHFIGWD